MKNPWGAGTVEVVERSLRTDASKARSVCLDKSPTRRVLDNHVESAYFHKEERSRMRVQVAMHAPAKRPHCFNICTDSRQCPDVSVCGSFRFVNPVGFLAGFLLMLSRLRLVLVCLCSRSHSTERGHNPGARMCRKSPGEVIYWTMKSIRGIYTARHAATIFRSPGWHQNLSLALPSLAFLSPALNECQC